MSLTTEVFGRSGLSRPSSYWIYYIITKSQDVRAALDKSETIPVVLMFWANQNVPCKVMMRPFWDMAMAKKKEAAFCRVDVDRCKDIAERYQVEALPTFLLIKQNKEEGRVVGAKVEELNTTIKNKI